MSSSSGQVWFTVQMKERENTIHRVVALFGAELEQHSVHQGELRGVRADERPNARDRDLSIWSGRRPGPLPQGGRVKDQVAAVFRRAMTAK